MYIYTNILFQISAYSKRSACGLSLENLLKLTFPSHITAIFGRVGNENGFDTHEERLTFRSLGGPTM